MNEVLVQSLEAFMSVQYGFPETDFSEGNLLLSIN